MPATRKSSSLMRRLGNFGLADDANELLRDLGGLMATGMAIPEALKSIAEDIGSRRMAKHIKHVLALVQKGENISDALTPTQLYSGHTLALIRLGEHTGRLPENFHIIDEQYRKETLFRSRLRSSILYSVIVFSLALIVGSITAWYTLPKIGTLYLELDVKLPFITQIIITLGKVLYHYGSIIIPMLIISLVSTLYFLFSFPRTKFIGHFVLFKIPLIRKLIKEVEISRFGYFLGTMLQVGLPTLESISALINISTFHNYQSLYRHIYNEVRIGHTIHDALLNYPRSKKLFTPAVRQMIKAAEQSGSLADTLVRIGAIYEQKTETTARDLPIIIEPILLILIALTVVLLALGTILPIYSLIETLQQ